jgi:hypothetical protein
VFDLASKTESLAKKFSVAPSVMAKASNSVRQFNDTLMVFDETCSNTIALPTTVFHKLGHKLKLKIKSLLACNKYQKCNHLINPIANADVISFLRTDVPLMPVVIFVKHLSSIPIHRI